MSKDMAYEVALQRLLNREKELVEILTLYNEALVKIQELEREVKGLNDIIDKLEEEDNNN